MDAVRSELPPANLVFLVDVSGSMTAANKLPLLKNALRLLTDTLRPQDRVSLVTYASGTRVVLPPTPAVSAADPRRARRAAAGRLHRLARPASGWPTRWRARPTARRASTASCWPPTATSTSACRTSRRLKALVEDRRKSGFR